MKNTQYSMVILAAAGLFFAGALSVSAQSVGQYPYMGDNTTYGYQETTSSSYADSTYGYGNMVPEYGYGSYASPYTSVCGDICAQTLAMRPEIAQQQNSWDLYGFSSNSYPYLGNPWQNPEPQYQANPYQQGMYPVSTGTGSNVVYGNQYLSNTYNEYYAPVQQMTTSYPQDELRGYTSF